MKTNQKYIFILLFGLVFSLLMQPTMTRAVPMDSVHYMVSGNLERFEALKLKVEDRIDHVNQAYLTTIYNGKDLDLAGRWNIIFLERSIYRVKLGLALTLDLEQFKVGKGIGIAGEGQYLEQNKYFWETTYYFDRKMNWVYEGGIALPLTPTTFLTLSAGNTYWKPTDPVMSIGIKVEM